MTSSACVVTPVYKFPLSEDEQISLSSFRYHLKKYDRYFIVPKNKNNNLKRICDDEFLIELPTHFFKNISGYNALMLTPSFYETFQRYNFILIAQLDALVLNDKLQHWCDQGWDYIGAPWMKNYLYSDHAEFTAVGNGGFSLRKVSIALDILNMKLDKKTTNILLSDKKLWGKQSAYRYLPSNLIRNIYKNHRTHNLLKLHYRGNEDVFWGKYANSINNHFKVPPASEALKFSFEINPSKCLEYNSGIMPFGCHGWAKYDRSFWAKYINSIL
jgi:hypothetical protein